MQLICLFLVVLMAFQPASLTNSRTYCGRALADARVLYCFGSDETIQKRKLPLPLYSAVADFDETSVENGVFSYELNDKNWPWQSKRQMTAARALLGRNKRNPGIVDKCCLKPCYINELLNYC